jgi:hypothetical protein
MQMKGVMMFHDGSDKGTVMTQPSCPGLPLMKRTGFMVMAETTHRERKKAIKVKSTVRSMLIILFDIKGISHKAFVFGWKLLSWVQQTGSIGVVAGVRRQRLVLSIGPTE